MDVQSEQRSQPGLRSDPDPTTSVMNPVAPASEPATAPVRTGASVQGNFFHEDPYPTFADTAPTPVVPGRKKRAYEPSKPKGSLGLRIAVIVLAWIVLVAAAALGLLESGLMHLHTGPSSGSGQSGQGATQAPASNSPLLSQTSTGAGSAAYSVNAKAFALDIQTTRPTWVSIGIVGQNPIYAGVLSPGSSKRQVFLGPAQLEVGAGGSSVIVSAGQKTQTISPPSAPFTYQFQPG